MAINVWPDEMAFNDPSKEIRLLDLLPLDLSGKLRARLRHVSLDKLPPFIAFSYVCGTENSERLLSLDGKNSSFDVTIFKNLESLLLGVYSCDEQTLPQLWDASGSLYPMWIDMICINQGNMNEKAVQIGLMGTIYRSAKLVIIWIEENSSELRYAFRYLKRLAEEARNGLDDSKYWHMFDPIGWASIRKLLECKWFERRWIVQEATLCRRAILVCGTSTVDIEDLFTGVNIAVKAMVRRPRSYRRGRRENRGGIWPLQMLKSVRHTDRTKAHPSQLLTLLEHFRHTFVSHSHDYLYSMFALCSDEEVAANPIRYDRPPEEAFLLFVKSHFKLYKDLEFLSLCRSSPVRANVEVSKMEDTSVLLPSWVPNWATGNVRRCLGVATVNKDDKFFKAGVFMHPKFLVEGNTATVRGASAGRIVAIDDFMDLYETADTKRRDSDLFSRLVDFWLAGPCSETGYLDEEDRFQSLINTMLLYSIQVPGKDRHEPRSLRHRFEVYFAGTKAMEALSRRGYQPKASHEYKPLGFVLSRLLNWRAFLTDQGLLGLAQPECEVGDHVCIVGGCSAPILLSPTVTEHWEVRGEVVLDKFMFGEADEMVKQGELSVQEFTLV